MANIIFWSGIWPENRSRSIGPYQLAYWLRKHNITAQVIDFCQWLTAEEIVELTELFLNDSTKYIGISTTFWINEIIPSNILNAINLIKKYNTSVKFIFGGPRCDSDAVKKVADICILGEAEDKLINLFRSHNIGTSFFDITKLSHRFDPQDCILDGEVLPIELGRGCIFKCKFCSHHNLGKPKQTYQRSIHLVEEEMIYNYENFKTTNYYFLDDTVNEDMEKVKNLSKIPKNIGININWVGYLRADLLWSYEDSPYLLSESGLQSCFFGIESFHPTASRLIGKGWSGKHAKDYLPILYKDIWKSEIPIWSNFIIGLPEEDVDGLLSTLQWCLENPIGTHRFVELSLYTQRQDSGTKSEFTKNYIDYGYTLDEKKSWKTEIMDQITARKMCQEFNTKLAQNNTLSCWFLFDLLNYNKNISELKKIKFVDLRAYKENFPASTFIQQYKNKLKEIGQ